MKYFLFFVFAILIGCAALPLFIEDLNELSEIKEEINECISQKRYWEETDELYENDIFCVIEPWNDPQFQESKEDFEKYKESMKNYSDYYNYHFGPEIS